MAKITHRSKFAPEAPAVLPPIAGVGLATCEANIRYTDRSDLLAMTFVEGTSVAGVLTRTGAPSAPVDWCRKHLASGTARACIVNAGNANAFTGQAGADAAEITAQTAAEALGVDAANVFLASTGVIGEVLATAPIRTHLPGLCRQAATSTADSAGWQAAADAIMTTDTFPKLASVTCEIDGVTCTLNGIAKGSGMIAPDMATMLAFVATDAAVTPACLHALLTRRTATTFNAITVDSDTSTSDTLLAFATGRVPNAPAPLDDPDALRAEMFDQALNELLHVLAMQVIGDGEGITKRMMVNVSGATSDESAKRVARAIADSPLVKTAVAGADPNWGRIVMAIGKSGEPVKRDLITIQIGDVIVAQNGAVAPNYHEPDAAAHMREDDIQIYVQLGLGKHAATIWGCDLTHAYIDINADYRS